MMERLNMRLPSLSFGRFDDVLDRQMVLYVVYTVVLFVGFLVWTFPYADVVGRVLGMVESSAVDVEFKEARFAWHRGLALTDVRLSSPTGEPPEPYLEVDTLWVRPNIRELLGMIRGNLYALTVDAELYGGSANGVLRVKDQVMSGSVDVNAISLGRYRSLTALLEEGNLAGRVSGQLSFEAAGPDIESGQASGEVRLENAGLEKAKISGFGVPDLHFANSQLNFTLRQGRLEIEELNAAGDELNISASGQITLRDPLDSSVLNLKATVLPGKNAPDSIRGLIALIPKPRDAKPDAPVRISGTLHNPRFR
jgi:type II secretion system protein N